MINIKWDKNYAVDYEKIDNEHRVFVDLIRSSSDAIDSHLDVDSVCRQLEELALYAKFHFFSEENLMINNKYPFYREHKNEHTHLLDVLEQKMINYRDHTENGESLIQFIFEWFVLHTMKTDKHLANYLNKRAASKTIY